jgi:hypothetical protein
MLYLRANSFLAVRLYVCFQNILTISIYANCFILKGVSPVVAGLEGSEMRVVHMGPANCYLSYAA